MDNTTKGIIKPSIPDTSMDPGAPLNGVALPTVLVGLVVELAVVILIPVALVIDTVLLPTRGSIVAVGVAVVPVDPGIELNKLANGITLAVGVLIALVSPKCIVVAVVSPKYILVVLDAAPGIGANKVYESSLVALALTPEP
jgi:hypothetical protein